MGQPNSEYANWSAVGWTAGVAALAAFLGGGHWVWAGHARAASAADVLAARPGE